MLSARFDQSQPSTEHLLCCCDGHDADFQIPIACSVAACHSLLFELHGTTVASYPLNRDEHEYGCSELLGSGPKCHERKSATKNDFFIAWRCWGAFVACESHSRQTSSLQSTRRHVRHGDTNHAHGPHTAL